jgi:hypothetical protein
MDTLFRGNASVASGRVKLTAPPADPRSSQRDVPLERSLLASPLRIAYPFSLGEEREPPEGAHVFI